MFGKKIVIECPHCGVVHEVRRGLFSKSKIKCHCGEVIDVKTESMVTKECPKCGNYVVYDKAIKDPICPVCHEHLKHENDDFKYREVICPNCGCKISVKKEDTETNCPLCGEYIDVEQRLREQQYRDRKQPLLIKSSKESNILVWKYPIEDFSYGTQIVVDESEVAVFISNGRVIGEFKPGKHMVDVDHIKIGEETYDKKGSFTSQLYFISTTLQSNMKWGTDSKIGLFDPASGMHIEIGACGTFNYYIDDVEKFLFYVIGLGSISEYGVSSSDVMTKFKPNIVRVFKTELARVIKDSKINILEIDERVTDISAKLLKIINGDIDKFGIRLQDFIIENIALPVDDPNFKKMKEQYAYRYLKVTDEEIATDVAEAAHSKVMAETANATDVEIAKAKAEAEIEIIKAKAKAQASMYQSEASANDMKLRGYTYGDETERIVASKPSAQVKLNDEPWVCPTCHASGITTNFCPNCGTRRPSAEPAKWDCPECGEKNITSKFCPNCGHRRDN